MLEPLAAALSASHRVVLASGSPRRREILSNGSSLAFEVVPSTADENLARAAFAQRPWAYAEQTALLKATEVFNRLTNDGKDMRTLVVIGADTVVSLDGVIHGKPSSERDAAAMLTKLSGRSHRVYTGVSLLSSASSESRLFHEQTLVRFDALDAAVVEAYVATGEPMDKAGGYGIQALGGTLVAGIEGDYFNVMGLPLNKFCKEFTDFVRRSGTPE